MATTIVWFRQDLRVTDNPALILAAKHGEVIPVYIFDENSPSIAELGGSSKWWLHHALKSLNESLGGKLLTFKGDPEKILGSLCDEFDVSGVYWSRMYEAYARERDTKIKQAIKDKDVDAVSVNGSLLWEPMKITKNDGTPYKVYTPYYKNGCLKAPSPRYPEAKPEISFARTRDNLTDKVKLDDMSLLPTISWDTTINKLWNVSEQGAKDKLAVFIKDAITDYNDDRNIPSVKGTSQLSPYLHFGLISPNQAWYAVLDAFDGEMSNNGVYVYLSELGWREFSYYLLFHFESIQTKNFNSKFDSFPWQQNDQHLKAWQTGKTGIPIVDAGMRELYSTGYMHNRVRMIVASFLVKNLLIDWRKGERWFWDCLLDADTASNSAGWQWVAGSGADAAPYFRIFNPVLQGEKFDKQGEYVKKYCPELSQLPNKYIHKPWDAPDIILKQAKIELGVDYPNPIADLKESRVAALDAYKEIK